MGRHALAAVVLLAAAAGSAPAQVLFEGRALADRVARVSRSLRWHSSFGHAAAVARRSDKPILWVQALGDLRGFT